MSLRTRHHLPTQRDRTRAELAELAAAISVEIGERRRRVGLPDDHDEHLVESGRVELPIPHRPRRRPVVAPVALALATAVVAALAVVTYRTAHATADSSPQTTAKPTATAPAAAPPAGTPAALGAAAAKRLGGNGRPVDVFACEGAYAGDAARSGGVLPIPGPGTAAYQGYVDACVSDMSGVSARQVA